MHFFFFFNACTVPVLHRSVRNSGNCVVGMLCSAQSSVVEMAFRVKRLSGGDHQRPVANVLAFCLVPDVVWHSYDSAMSPGHVEGGGLASFYCYSYFIVVDFIALICELTYCKMVSMAKCNGMIINIILNT